MDVEVWVDAGGEVARRSLRSARVRRLLRSAGALLRACHPVPAVAVGVLTTALAAAYGQDAAGCLLVAAAVLTGQLSVGWSNDAVDAARDSAVGRRTKPVVAGSVGVTAVRGAALTALALCVPLSLAYGPLAGTVHLVGVAAAWAYNFGLKATVLSWLPYAVGFAALPAFVSLGLEGRPWPPWWIVVSAALLGIGAHLANVLPDIGDDLATGVRGWPQRLGPARGRLLLPLPLVTATALLAFARPGPAGTAGPAALSVAVVVAAGGALLGRRRPRLPFLAAILVAAVDAALLLSQGAAVT
ncbi:UbiA family prenyltransferase [Streptomyces flavidovirens]|uniref:UbiA family prenyltransferase n=1 Tax=Streptomyces flavidovirens TaxID=67298 RepID=UPI003421212F